MQRAVEAAASPSLSEIGTQSCPSDTVSFRARQVVGNKYDSYAKFLMEESVDAGYAPLLRISAAGLMIVRSSSL